MRNALAATLMLIVLGQAAPARSAPIFVEDFESNEATGWAPSGADARLTQYEGNTSLRLSGDSAAVRAVSTRGFTEVSLSVAMAGSDLGSRGECRVEASVDDGQTWMQVLVIGRAQADGVTLHSGVLGHPGLDDAERILIGARSSGPAAARCWMDNVRVAGTPIPTMSARAALSRQDFDSQIAPSALVDMAAFAPAAEAEGASHGLDGVLAFDATPMAGFVVHRDDLGYRALDGLELDQLPALEIGLATRGDQLIPLTRGPIPGAHPSWELALEPGRIWREPTDGGLLRAALPFALIEINANCTHNGVLTFLFNAQGVASQIVWQVASETCAYLQFDAWGTLQARFNPGLPDNVEQAELTPEPSLPTRPLSALRSDHPDIDPRAFASPAEVDPRALTTFGVVIEGVHYLGDCPTRAGPYPYCEAILLPSYSLAKSMAAGLGLMRLERLYPGARSARIADYLPACSDWGEVTFEQALDMTTGRYRSSDDQADEDAMLSHDFFQAEGNDDKLRIACTLFPQREAPGRRWVYHTTDTYVLGAAMNAFWRERQGDDADVFQDVLADGLYRELGLSGAMSATRRTRDADAQAFFGWGLTLTRQDIASLGAWLTQPMTHPDLVDPAMFSAALQRNPGERGLPAGAESLRYNDGFWAWNAQAALGCSAPVWIPAMSGYGGLIVALMPNGVTYYYVSDGGDYAWARAARAANAVSSMCEESRP